MDELTSDLARRVSAIDIATLPADAVWEAKRRLLDSVACAMAAFDEPFCSGIRGLAGRYGGHPSARIWGTGAASSIEMAGFANATMMRYLDMNDTFLGLTAGHPSDMVPGLIALAEGFGIGGARLIEGIVSAYELYCGLCSATALQLHGIDQSTAAALGAAGGASRILGLDENATASALALALAANLNLYNVRCGILSDWKACAGPNGARGGMFAALLAREGVHGPTAVFDGEGGFHDVVGPLRFEIDMSAAPRIMMTRLKAYPVCYHGQSAVNAATTLAPLVTGAQIARVRVETYDAAVRAMAADPSRWTPTTREGADHSLPYTVAVALMSGQLSSADYGPDRLCDSALRDLMAKIVVERSEAFTLAYPGTAWSRVTVTLNDGEVLSAEQAQPKGHPQNPLSDQELAQKLSGSWPKQLPATSAARVLDLVRALDSASSVVPLVDALCPAP